MVTVLKYSNFLINKYCQVCPSTVAINNKLGVYKATNLKD